MAPTTQARPLNGYRAVVPGGSPAASPLDAAPEEHVAVVAIHGMGQQVPFETLEGVADVIRRGLPAGAAGETRTRFANLDGKTLPRAEITVGSRDVHLYEVYWAPLTEAKVSLRDVLDFVFSALANVRRNSQAIHFERVLFNWSEHFAVRLGSLGLLALAFLVVSAFSLIVVLAGIVGGTGVLTWSKPDWISPELITNMSLDLVVFAVLVGGGMLVGVRLPQWTGFRAGHRVPPAAVVAVAWGFVVLALVGILVVPGLMLYHLGHRSEIQAWPGLGWLASFLDRRSDDDAIGWNRFLKGAAFVAVVGLWAAAAAVWTKLRTILIQFPGDVAAYISSHRVSRFADLRDDIQAKASDVLGAVYKAEASEGRTYDRVIVVAHSLGSVVAYDCLNKITIQDEIAGDHLAVAPRTSLFLTFGSPLDKIAYVFRVQRPKACLLRETLAQSRQPFILDYRLRPRRWVNLYSPSDVIGARLDYFDLTLPTPDAAPHGGTQRVCNVADPDAFTPLTAHTEHWNSRLLAYVMAEAVCGRLPDDTALQRRAQELRNGGLGSPSRKTAPAR